MLDMNFLGGLHEVAIGVLDDESIKKIVLGPETRVPTLSHKKGQKWA